MQGVAVHIGAEPLLRARRRWLLPLIAKQQILATCSRTEWNQSLYSGDVRRRSCRVMSRFLVQVFARFVDQVAILVTVRVVLT